MKFVGIADKRGNRSIAKCLMISVRILVAREGNLGLWEDESIGADC